MSVSEATYLQIVLEDPDSKWELHCGQLRSKPAMTWEHNRVAWRLGFRLQEQLDLAQFEVRVDAGRVRRSGSQYYIPDVIVIPVAAAAHLFAEPGTVEAYPLPLPLVVEVWSPSTGRDDLREKLPAYQARGDAEIWLFHPYDHLVRIWRQQMDGSYAETILRGGSVQLAALPNVTIDLDELFSLSE
jgi:Uma2 family endonuclease